MTTKLPEILLLSGSLRKDSTCEAVLRTAQAVARSVPVATCATPVWPGSRTSIPTTTATRCPPR
jgi:hypothetical protein